MAAAARGGGDYTRRGGLAGAAGHFVGAFTAGQRKWDATIRSSTFGAIIVLLLRIGERQLDADRKMRAEQHEQTIQVLKDLKDAMDRLERTTRDHIGGGR